MQTKLLLYRDRKPTEANVFVAAAGTSLKEQDSAGRRERMRLVPVNF